jgi:hypothetical protein
MDISTCEIISFSAVSSPRAQRSSRCEPGEPSRPDLTPRRARPAEAASVSWPEPPAPHLTVHAQTGAGAGTLPPADAGGFSTLRATMAGLHAGNLSRLTPGASPRDETRKFQRTSFAG